LWSQSAKISGSMGKSSRTDTMLLWKIQFDQRNMNILR
jgi:hypothetical protein